MSFAVVVVYLLVAHIMSEVLPPVDHRDKPTLTSEVTHDT